MRRLVLYTKTPQVSMLFASPTKRTPRLVRWTQREFAHVYVQFGSLIGMSVNHGKDFQWVCPKTMSRVMAQSGTKRVVRCSMPARYASYTAIAMGTPVDHCKTYLDMVFPFMGLTANNCVSYAQSVAETESGVVFHKRARTPKGLLNLLVDNGWTTEEIDHYVY